MTAIDELTKAFQDTAHAHHEAFAAVDGVDPDWAIWYAERLAPRFAALLDAPQSRSEIVGLLLSLATEHEARGEGVPWARFYAEQTATRFIAAGQETLALYQFPSCPYCAMVLRTIDELGIDVELRDVLREPKWRDELISVRGRGTVPVLQCVSVEGQVRWLPESRDIIKYLRKRFAG